jgi:hypothetical protein
VLQSGEIVRFWGGEMKLLFARYRKLTTSGFLECCLVLGLCMILESVVAAKTPASSPASESEEAVHFPLEKGASEWGWMTGGATNLPGGAMSRGFWMLDLRWGRVLTGIHGPGPLRGTLEYALEVVPALVVRQSTPIFGGGFNPLLLQYNFAVSRRIVPFIQAGAGALVSDRTLPAHSSQFNFTPQGGFGVYLFRRSTSAISVGLRYHHISNAGIRRPNPGLNSMYFYSGFSWWR